ncbi:hypothetical protein, partial [Actinoplanes xinjiangensis]|uniref:hypothetical protein n=1 Tax=Actinoplanes xinjiangensis TaxID=512350 RepID=UPI003412B585
QNTWPPAWNSGVRPRRDQKTISQDFVLTVDSTTARGRRHHATLIGTAAHRAEAVQHHRLKRDNSITA